MYLRASALPRDRAAGLVRVPDPAEGDEPAALTAILRENTADPVVREALEVSSDSLAAVLRRVDDGEPVGIGQLRRATFAACRYLLRMTGRPTPFGLLAGVAIGHFAEHARVTGTPEHGKRVRPDGEWLGTLLGDLETRPEVLRHLRVCVNDLCYERGGRFVLPYTPMDKTADSRTSEKSVRATPPVRIAMAAAREPIMAGELTERIRAAYPNTGTARIAALLAELVAHGLLCTELPPPPYETDPLTHAVTVLDRTPAPEAAGLRTLGKLFAEFAEAPPGAGRAACAAARTAARELRPESTAPPMQVDLRLATEIALPHGIAREAEAAATALLRISPADGVPGYLAEYHAHFLDRYGIGAIVPVTEVLDPERGIGPPAGYVLPAESRRRPPVPEPDTAREERIGELVFQALRGDDRILLDADTITALEPDGPPAPLPATVELAFGLHAESTAALDRGDFLLLFAPAMGQHAGAMLGRFAYLFEDGAEQLATVLAAESRDSATVQLAFQPAGGRLSNVTRVPAVLDRTLTIGGFAERAAESVLGLDEIGIVAEPDGLRVVSLRDRRRLTALTPHMLDPRKRAPNAARLLGDISAAATRTLRAWDWGALQCLPHLPRVQHGRTVLAPASWRPPARLVDAVRESADWGRELDRWRERAGVPEHVHAKLADHSLPLDLRAPLHRRLFADELRRKPDLVVSEPIGDGDSPFGWLGGHANEIVIPLAANTPEPVTHGGPWTPASPRSVRAPGGDWLYAKVYSGRAKHNEILAEHLPRLLDSVPSTVDRWFFVRYTDPEDHLRIRMHGEPASLNQDLLPALHSWMAELRAAGLARVLVLDTYEPEIDRYGGPGTLDVAEHVFCADSRAVLGLLRLPDAEACPDIVLGAVGFADLLRCLDSRWVHWYDEIPIEHYDGMSAHVRQAVQLTEAVLNRDAGEPGTRMGQALAGRRPVFARYGERLRAAEQDEPHFRATVNSLLHMHHNRLLGGDRQTENRVHAVASRIAAHYRGRAAAARS